jgi:Cu/Ag efflux pump CusA
VWVGCSNMSSSTAVASIALPTCARFRTGRFVTSLRPCPELRKVASIGGFVKQYQVQLDPNRLLAYGIPLSTVIDRVRASTNEVGGRVLEMNGARYMVRGLGYLRSLGDLENVPVMAKNGTPVLIKDLGTVSFGPRIREGVAEWQGEGEAVGGIVVMRYGENALNVINGIKKKVAEIAPSLPTGVEIHSGYDRSGLIEESIRTLKRDLLVECAIVSLVTIIFLFHFQSALIPISHVAGRSAWRIRADVPSAHQQQYYVFRRFCPCDWRIDRCGHRHCREWLSAPFRSWPRYRRRAPTNSH